MSREDMVVVFRGQELHLKPFGNIAWRSDSGVMVMDRPRAYRDGDRFRWEASYRRRLRFGAGSCSAVGHGRTEQEAVSAMERAMEVGR